MCACLAQQLHVKGMFPCEQIESKHLGLLTSSYYEAIDCPKSDEVLEI